jgi:hypothetical protein
MVAGCAFELANEDWRSAAVPSHPLCLQPQNLISNSLHYTIFSSFSFVYFMFYLTMLSVPQTNQRRVVGCLMNDEFERMWKEAVVAYFKVLSRYSPGGISVSIIDVPAEIRKGYLQNIIKKRYSLNKFSRFKLFEAWWLLCVQPVLISKLWILPTQCMYLFHIILRINVDYIISLNSITLLIFILRTQFISCEIEN